MQIKRVQACLLLVSVCCPVGANATVDIIAIDGGVIRMTSHESSNSILKTIPVNIPENGTASDGYMVISSYALLDNGRSIYESSIPGIGFSLCQGEGERCLRPSGQKIMPGTNYSLRIYKTGAVKGGDYAPGTLVTLNSARSKRDITLSHLAVHNMACVTSQNSLRVRFPPATITERKTELANISFTLPVVCQNQNDYRNVALTFSYSGEYYDDTTLKTNLSGLGLRIKDALGNTVRIARSTPRIYQDMSFTASLVRLPGIAVQAGNINVAATVTISMR